MLHAYLFHSYQIYFMEKFSKQISIIFCIAALPLICSFLPPVEALPITWQDLRDVRFTRKLNDNIGMHILYPEFGAKVKALEGKEIQIRGFMIPVDPTEKIFVLSAKPMASCFFCGGSGPESIIQLKMKEAKRFVTDDIWVVKGILKLNADNIDELNYILVDTQPVRKVN